MSFPFTETPSDDDCYPLDVMMLLNLNIGNPQNPLSLPIGTISVAHSPEVAPCYVQVAVCGNWMTDSDGARIAPGFWELMGEDKVSFSLLDLNLLRKHCPEMATVEVNHPANITPDLRNQFWLLTRWAHTQERFGNKSAAQIAVELASTVDGTVR